jgi:hypothetical protein
MLEQQANQDINAYKQSVIDNGGVWPSDQPKQATGKDLLQGQMNQINTPSTTLNSVLNTAPTQAPQATPTPDAFQQMLRAKFQPAQYGQPAQ